MKAYRKAWLVTVLLLAIPAAFKAWAATQGSLGTTSTATTVITVVIPEILRISGMDDLNLGTWPGTGALSANDDLCVYSNASDGRYRLTITDDSTLSPTGFSAQNAAGTAHIPFTVRWNGTTGTTGNVNVNYNTRRASTGANSLSTDCSVGGLSANLFVNFTAANLQAAPGSTYSSTLTVMVEP